MKRLEIGDSLDFYAMSYNETRSKLMKVLNDPKYSINAKKLSGILQDKKESPLELAIWWLEWLLRHPNIENVASPVQNLSYFVGNSFDVLTMAIFYVLLHIVLLFVLIYLCCRKHVFRFFILVDTYYRKYCGKHEKQC